MSSVVTVVFQSLGKRDIEIAQRVEDVFTFKSLVDGGEGVSTEDDPAVETVAREELLSPPN